MLEALKKNESFSYKKLSAEEMAARGILGRLVGPCADFTIPTRNGRKYNEQLWDKVFSDEIVIEKINNKCLFGEFGHPADREEVDPDKIAIALNAVPKKNADGQLMACFDILNTPSGKILKAVCDYGANIGISSRGSGDIIEEMGEEIVDPETYYFECFDAVILPAVKAARLNYMTESVDKKALKLRKTLTEQLENASEEDKKIMKETLKNLNIELEESSSEWDDVPMIEDEELDNVLTEAEELEVDEEIEAVEDEAAEEEVEDEIEEVEESEAEEDSEIEENEESEEVEDEPEEIEEESDELLVKNLIDELSQFDENLPVYIKPIEIDGVEYNISLEFEDNDGVINVGAICDPIVDDNAEIDEEENLPAEEIDAEEIAIDETEVEAPVEEIEEAEEIEADEEETETAEDSGEDEEILESLKEMLRQKELLENEIKSLKRKEAVRDAKVTKLEEELNKYKNGFIRMSEVANEKSKFEKEVKVLQEQMAQKDSKIKNLESKVQASVRLTESVESNAKKVKLLTEKFDALKAEKETSEKALKAQVAQNSKKLEESVKVAKQYKTKCAAILNKYIESKANMLGVKPAEITNRLNESYTLADIDNVCNELLSYNVKMNSLPFGTNRTSKAYVKESTKPSRPVNNSGYEIDDSLLELAGLK